MVPGKSLPIVRRSALRLAALAAVTAGVLAPAQAETPPIRPTPPEKAPGAQAPVKIFGAGTYQPVNPAALRAPRKIVPLSGEQKKRLIGRDPGTHHITLTIANAVVKGKASLHFRNASDVIPDWNEAWLVPSTKSNIDLALETEANKTYWIEVVVWRNDPKEPCNGFTVKGPDSSVQKFACTQVFSAAKDGQHLMFGYAAPSAGRRYFTLWAHQTTEVFRYEITVQ